MPQPHWSSREFTMAAAALNLELLARQASLV